MLVVPLSGSIRSNSLKSTVLPFACSFSARFLVASISAFDDDGIPRRAVASSRPSVPLRATARPCRIARRQISSEPTAGVPVRDTSRAKPISQPSRHGMLLRCINAPSRLWAVKLTEARARPRRADASVV
jgi:hypothetical protein